jgi:adenylosuccinate lyase
MTVHFMDSILFGDSVGTAEMRAVFEEKERLQQWLEVEVALTKVQATLGIIPAQAAEQIARLAKIDQMDLVEMKKDGKVTGHSLMGLLKEFRRLVGAENAKYIHWGATTQDILDTGQMLCLKKAMQIIERQLVELMKKMLPLLKEHEQTLMVGRTHGQHALPITFGIKIAGWLDELSRGLDRLREGKKRILTGNITGGVGTYASWGSKGFEIQNETLRMLGLASPDTCWHSARDRSAEAMAILGIIASSGARIAKEIYNLSKTEFSELEEPFTMGKVGSSTMPHKRNPIHSEWVIVLARMIRSHALLAMDVMVMENERDASAWKTEWIIIPEACVMMSSLLAHLDFTFGGLIVRKEQMLKNIDMLKGLLLSEQVMFKLTKSIPLPQAHEAVYEASMAAYEKGTAFLDELMAIPEISSQFERQDLEAALDARSYLGLSVDIARNVAKKVSAQLSAVEK